MFVVTAQILPFTVLTDFILVLESHSVEHFGVVEPSMYCIRLLNHWLVSVERLYLQDLLSRSHATVNSTWQTSYRPITIVADRSSACARAYAITCYSLYGRFRPFSPSCLLAHWQSYRLLRLGSRFNPTIRSYFFLNCSASVR